jgi:hypothetical protein
MKVSFLYHVQFLFDMTSQTSTLRTRTEMVFETLVYSQLNHLTRLIARENFIILSRRESNKSHFCLTYYESFALNAPRLQDASEEVITSLFSVLKELWTLKL